MAEADYDLRKQLEPVAPLVRDQYTKMVRLALGHLYDDPSERKPIGRIFDPRISAVVGETSSFTPAL
jgi:hypothetical protein